jgi:pimeloyl-ACP methyl ester carboxylesterase
MFIWLDRATRPGPAPSAPSAAATKAISPAESSGLEDTACWFPIPSGRHARCGILTVPEQWQAARSRSLHLRLVVFRGDAPGLADSLIYLNGGPGEPAQIDADSIGRWWDWIERTNWLKKRDLVVFDYRGVGLSEPLMNCPELADVAYRVFGEPLGLRQSSEAWSSAARQCRDRLRDAGIDVSNYNTETIVEDLRSLIDHLGYRSWSLLAVSYGTRVALDFVDRWPEGTRAVILDSVYPANVNAYVESGRAAAAAFAAVFRDCAADRACHSSFPGLAATFDQVLQRARVTPVMVNLADPRDGSRLQLRLDDGKLIDVLLYAFYDWRDIARLPAIVAALAQGDSRPIEGLAGQAFSTFTSPRLSHGLFFSVECHDEFPDNRQAEIDRAATELPRYRNFILSNLPLTVCPSWPVSPIPDRSNAPVGSDVPILMLSGELDALTPPQWAKQAATNLPKAVQIEFRGVGHGVLEAHGCADLIVERFLNDPIRSPVDDCLLAVGPPHFGNAPTGR